MAVEVCNKHFSLQFAFFSFSETEIQLIVKTNYGTIITENNHLFQQIYGCRLSYISNLNARQNTKSACRPFPSVGNDDYSVSWQNMLLPLSLQSHSWCRSLTWHARGKKARKLTGFFTGSSQVQHTNIRQTNRWANYLKSPVTSARSLKVVGKQTWRKTKVKTPSSIRGCFKLTRVLAMRQ